MPCREQDRLGPRQPAAAVAQPAAAHEAAVLGEARRDDRRAAALLNRRSVWPTHRIRWFLSVQPSLGERR